MDSSTASVCSVRIHTRLSMLYRLGVLYRLLYRLEHGSVTVLTEDGSITVWNASTWEVERSLEGHGVFYTFIG
ncbi:hypothetical protein T484DRAFT_1783546 [Baffinella frigidus]|nr:hypothetical protein T484DRAFT_1783546 [Cryptophyta sp. CCMP2293]